MSITSFVKRHLKKRKAIGFYRALVKSGDLCFDIGANVGERTGILLEAGCRVVSVEPQEACFSQLQEKYSANSNVTIVKTALSNRAGEMTLRLCSETTQCATFSDEFANTYQRVSGFHWHKSETVQVTTLGKMVQQYGTPALCKIDVEGHELEVLQGMETPLPLIMFEFNKPLLHQTINCLQLLSQKGDYKVNYMAYESMGTALPHWLRITDFLRDIYRILPENILTGEIIAKI